MRLRVNSTWSFEVLEVIRVVDGDTFWLRIDQPWREIKTINCRLRGVDTWEMRGKDPKGEAAKQFVVDFFDKYIAHPLWVEITNGDEWDNFGRVLGAVFALENDNTVICLADELRANGHEKKSS